MRWFAGILLVLVALLAARLVLDRGPGLPPGAQAHHEVQVASPAAAPGATDPEDAALAVETPVGREPGRLSIDATDVAARVLDADGEPVSGARLSWTPFTPAVAASEPSWDAIDRQALAQVTLWAESSADGSFAFAKPPDGTSPYGSVVWVTHPGHAATPVLLSPETPLSGPIVLERAAARHARVVDPDGRSVGGAIVRQYALVEENAAEGPPTWARRLFSREGTSDADGAAPLTTFAGREVLAAQHGRRVAAPLERECAGDVVLTLAPSFTVEGLVLLERGTLEAGATRVVAAAPQGEKEWTALASATVSVAGRWGPTALPLLATDTYRFTLEGGGVVRQDREIVPPLEDEIVRVDFDAALGVDAFFMAVDAATGEPLLDALLKVHWLEPDGSWTTIEAHPNEDGYILARGCRPGAIHYDARAPGYAFARRGPQIVPEEEPATWVVELLPAGRVLGRCQFVGAPVAAFTVTHWPADAVAQVRNEVVEGSEDGSFVLDDVQEGQLNLVAHAEGHGQSEVQRVAITAGEATEVTLELTQAERGRGRVIDQVTRQPIAGASIQLFATSGSQPIDPAGTPATSDAEGRFELTGLSTIASTFWTRAEGYSGSYTTVHGTPGRTVDLGLVALAPAQPLELRLRCAAGEAPTRYAVSTRLYGLPKTPFPADGVVRLDAFPAGFYEFVVDLPDRSTFDVPLELVPGEEWSFDLPVDGTARLRLDVLPEEGHDLPAEVWVFVKYAAQRSTMDRIALLPPSGRITLDRLLPGPCYVQLEEGPLLVASEPLDLQPDTETSLQLPLGQTVRRFRVVDSDGASLPSTSILFAIDGDEHAQIGGTTDAHGEFRCGGFTDGTVTAHLKHATLGTAVAVPVDLSGDPSDVIELPFEADASWSAVLRDGEEALPGITCSLFPHGSNMILSQDKTTDGEGRVSWDRLGRGTYDLVARHPESWPVEVTLPTNEGAPHVVQVRRRGDLLVRVRRSNGAPLAAAPIELESVEFDVAVAEWLQPGLASASPGDLRTDDSGEVRVTGLPHGAYRWRVAVPASTPLQGTATVPAGELATVLVAAP